MYTWPNASNLKEKLEGICKGNFYANYSLGGHSWFKVGGCAEILFIPYDIKELQSFLNKKPADLEVTIIGGASNLLIRDNGIPGVVILLGKTFNFIEIINGIKINCGASLPNKKFSNFALKNNISGFSFLSTIPGTIGGSIKMNSGAYNCEVMDNLEKIDLINSNGDIISKLAKDIKYGYRYTDICDDMICISASFNAEHCERQVILEEISLYKQYRNKTQPIREKTGGSTFKNNKHKKAWELIKEAGCEDLCVGDACISEKHLNFIINKGNATAYDIELLGEIIKYRVEDKTGIQLDWEIKKIGHGPEVLI